MKLFARRGLFDSHRTGDFMNHGSFPPDSTEETTNGKSNVPASQSWRNRPWVRRVRRFGAIATVIVLALVCLTAPREPVTTDRESSWGAVLSYAHERGLQFGPEVIFTYGPLGFLTIPYFSAH